MRQAKVTKILTNTEENALIKLGPGRICLNILTLILSYLSRFSIRKVRINQSYWKSEKDRMSYSPWLDGILEVGLSRRHIGLGWFGPPTTHLTTHKQHIWAYLVIKRSTLFLILYNIKIESTNVDLKAEMIFCPTCFFTCCMVFPFFAHLWRHAVLQNASNASCQAMVNTSHEATRLSVNKLPLYDTNYKVMNTYLTKFSRPPSSDLFQMAPNPPTATVPPIIMLR